MGLRENLKRSSMPDEPMLPTPRSSATRTRSVEAPCTNKVVYHTMKVFSGLGLPVLRFNFRGVGLSEGDHDHGPGELDDARAAPDWLDSAMHLPILLAGFSFVAPSSE